MKARYQEEVVLSKEPSNLFANLLMFTFLVMFIFVIVSAIKKDVRTDNAKVTKMTKGWISFARDPYFGDGGENKVVIVTFSKDFVERSQNFLTKNDRSEILDPKNWQVIWVGQKLEGITVGHPEPKKPKTVWEYYNFVSN